MKILICGAGAIGSNLTRSLVPDLKGEHEITVLDMDTVEKRNIQAGTQFYTEDQIGLPKVEALQFNVYKWFNREIEIIHEKFVDDGNHSLREYGLVIDCFDNHEARKALQDVDNLDGILRWSAHSLLHIGFSDAFTFAIEWDENYKVPTNIEGLDICEMPGASAFVASVAALGSLVAQEWITNNKKIEIVGGKYVHTRIS